MRLTLRTLLAYLDDILPPQQAREIGMKVADNAAAQELIGRIRQVTRRRRLTTPEMTGSAETNVDPNVVAEYLDNALPPERIEELEKLCLESDVNLAEVAACHQILTVILGQPARVPPTAYQRMYGLVTGPEAIPDRAPPRLQRSPETAEVGGPEEGEEVGLFGLPAYHRSSTWMRQLVPVVMILLLILLVATVFFLSNGKVRETEIAADQAASPPAGQKPPPPPSQAEPAEEEPAPPPPEPVSAPLDPIALWAGWVPMWSGQVAIRPGMPANLFLVYGHEELAVPETGPPPVAARVVEPPSTRIVPLARLLPVKNKDAPPSLLLRQLAQDDFRLVRPESRINAGERLMALPGYRCELELDSKLRLSLVGGLPSQVENLFYEAVVLLHDNPAFDLDLTLDRGRTVISNRASGQASVRLRFLDQVWDVRLLQPETRIGFELHGRVPRGSGAWVPHVKVALLVHGGEAELTRDMQPEKLTAGKVLVWDRPSIGREPGLIVDLKDPPYWLKDTRANFPNEVRAALLAFQDRLNRKLPQVAEEKSAWVAITCEEMLQEPANWHRWLGLFCLGAIDQMRLVVRALDEAERHDMRFVALDVIRGWAGRKPKQDEPLAALLEQRGYSPSDIASFLQYLRGFDQVSVDTVRQLLDSLDSNRLILRELAFLNLNLIVPPDRLQEFRALPLQPPEVRQRAIETLRTRLLPK
jgi:hypothetical protein